MAFQDQIARALGLDDVSFEYGSDPDSLLDMVRRIRREGDDNHIPIVRFAPGKRLGRLVGFYDFKAVHETILKKSYVADPASFPITYERMARFFGAHLVQGRHSSLPGPSPLRRESRELYKPLAYGQMPSSEIVAEGSIPREVDFPRSLDEVPRTLEDLMPVLRELWDGVPTILHPDVSKFLFDESSSGEEGAGKLTLDSRTEAPVDCRSASGYAALSNEMYHGSRVLLLDWDFSGETAKVLAAQLTYMHDVFSCPTPVWIPLVRVAQANYSSVVLPSLTPDHRIYVRMGRTDEALEALPEGRCTQIIEIPGESEMISVGPTSLPSGVTQGHWAWRYAIER